LWLLSRLCTSFRSNDDTREPRTPFRDTHTHTHTRNDRSSAVREAQPVLVQRRIKLNCASPSTPRFTLSHVRFCHITTAFETRTAEIFRKINFDLTVGIHDNNSDSKGLIWQIWGSHSGFDAKYRLIVKPYS